MLYRHQFKVVGTGPFPIDMLRYDAVHPLSESDDSWAIHNSLSLGGSPPELRSEILRALGNDGGGPNPKRGWTVTLEKVTDDRRWVPEARRWASFLWYVVPNSHVIEKR